jgi:HPt (histidine-containing phosphotransfer) domain-containing protein
MGMNLEHLSYDVEGVSQELHVRPEALVKILKSFAQTLSEKIVQLNELAEKNDQEQLRAILHEVKGTAGNLRLKKICELADRMHQAIKNKESSMAIAMWFQAFKNQSFAFINLAKRF